MKRIILASTSPRRKELMEQTGFPFECVSSAYEEDMSIALRPEELVMHLSRGKAYDVAKKTQGAVVIGADTIVAYEGKVLGKPHTSENAKVMLRELSGKQSSIFTGITIIDTAASRSVSEASEMKVFFKVLSEKDIDSYVATGEPLDKAGAYAIQGVGKELIDHTEGDFNAAVGLPVEMLTAVLRVFTA